MLVYRYLMKCGLKASAVRIEPSPSGEGSAESWVRKRFVKEVNAYRVRQAKAATALIVVIDADTGSVQDRWAQLDQELSDAGKDTVGSREQIARLVPKRNIETWVLCLNEQVVDEETDYKKRRDDWNELIPQASERLFQWTRPEAELPNHCIASLRNGVEELSRLTF